MCRAGPRIADSGYDMAHEEKPGTAINGPGKEKVGSQARCKGLRRLHHRWMQIAGSIVCQNRPVKAPLNQPAPRTTAGITGELLCSQRTNQRRAALPREQKRLSQVV